MPNEPADVKRAELVHACESGDAAAAAKILDVAPHLLGPALWPAAIFQGQSDDVTRLLLDRGLDPNISSSPRKPLHLAADRGLLEVVRLLLQRGARLDVVDGENITPYQLLCCGLATPANVETIRAAFREAGAKDDIFTHIYLGHDEAVIALLCADASLARAKGPIGFTPLQTAARAARPAVVRFLLDCGDPADAPDVKNTPLWLACQSAADADRRIEVAAMLMAAGGNPRRECENRSTPLHIAAWRGPIAMVELLLRNNAKEWQCDSEGKKPLDYARAGVAADKAAIAELLDRPVIRDPNFRAAVQAIHSGDSASLRRLLVEHPNLATDRAIEPACYMPGYFKDPKLLWFVANNPTLMKTMPANLVDLTAAIIDDGADMADLKYTLELVLTSDPARDSGFQKPLIDLLMARGARVTPHAIEMTLGHGLSAIVEYLLTRGMPLTASAAAGLGRLDALDRLLPAADAAERHAALSMAVINRQHAAAARVLAAGADVNAFLVVHVHSTPLHQAAANNDVEMARLLLAHGAGLEIKDTLWNGTPIGWAQHLDHRDFVVFLQTSARPA